jgi:hypothetical protein
MNHRRFALLFSCGAVHRTIWRTVIGWDKDIYYTTGSFSIDRYMSLGVEILLCRVISIHIFIAITYHA